MKKIDANSLIELMLLPMDDERVLNMLEALGIEVPALGEKYAMDG